MESLEERNQKIIDAVIEKERRLCPGAIALIGVYGSFRTGDIHAHSDLDLLILINDDRGYQLGSTFIQEDFGVGHDIYCTSWESLEADAKYTQPNIAKLMNSKIVYCADKKYLNQWNALRKRAWRIMAKPFGPADLEKAEKWMNEAREYYGKAAAVRETDEDRAGEAWPCALIRAREAAGGVLYCVENAVAMLNKTYFKKGVHRCYNELAAMKKRPEALIERIEAVVSAAGLSSLQEALACLMEAMEETFRKEREALGKSPEDPERAAAGAGMEMKADIEDAEMSAEANIGTAAEMSAEPDTGTAAEEAPARRQPMPDDLRGTYEEMVSNWMGKMVLARQTGDKHLAFMSLASCQSMIDDIAAEVEIRDYHVFLAYEPDRLDRTAGNFSVILLQYALEYEKVGLKVRRYPDTDAFVEDYVNK